MWFEGGRLAGMGGRGNLCGVKTRAKRDFSSKGLRVNVGASRKSVGASMDLVPFVCGWWC